MPTNMTKIIESEVTKFFEEIKPWKQETLETIRYSTSFKAFLRLYLFRTLQAAVIEMLPEERACLLGHEDPDSYYDCGLVHGFNSALALIKAKGREWDGKEVK